MSTKKERREQECKEALLNWLKPGDTVYCKLNHVSRSGMYRVIDLFTIKDNQPIRLSGYASDLLAGYDYKHKGCKASGCGMDMGFSLVYNLGMVLFPEWECIGNKCPHNSHVNYRGAGDSPRGAGVIHKYGYALLCEWI